MLAFGQWRCNDQRALLLTIGATDLVQSFNLRVRDLNTGAIVLDRPDEQITTNANPNRDISVPGEELKLSIEFPGSGHFLLHVVGRGGAASDQLFVALREFRVDGIAERRVTLIPLEHDEDGDKFPACGAYGSCDVYQNALSCSYLDCDDELEGGGADINPFAVERCGNGRDDDCSARCGAAPEAGDVPCVDKDGDGVPEGEDCDDEDPCRAPPRVVDGKEFFGEAKNLCDYRDKAFPQLAQACLDKLAAQGGEWQEPYCGDEVDQDCDGTDVKCEVDEDCDGSPWPEDCDDQDPAINPGAEEVCDQKDNDCDDVTDEGCTPCDVDGDGFAALDSGAAGCDKPLDPDDCDASVHTETTKGEPNGREGGTARGALRRFCGAELDKEGRPQRDIDHDVDGLAAKDDGCAPAACDKDGDGFAAAGCGSPPPTPDVADCRDDPDLDPDAAKSFPGAPDFCDDDVNQNCGSDRTCDGDGDGDGYLPPDDCNDRNPEVKPWAVELCDGVDNDCDGLVDEGNPDYTGAPIISANATCTDFSEGECAPCADGNPTCAREERRMTGFCCCSKAVPIRDSKYTLVAEKRVMCSGEDDALGVAQRCFVPTEFQPKPEKCDERDHDCDGIADDPDGSNLEEILFGLACSIDTGMCERGKVTGCDLDHELPHAPLLQSILGDAINVNWLCSGDTVLPRPELCNGCDDDCDDSLPNSPASADEVDTDGDGYLACDGCTDREVSGFCGAVKGCGDCNDEQASINPEAKDICNGVNDDCSDATADGVDECGGTATPDCCSQLSLCVDLQKDENHCGNCTTRCTGADVDGCAGGDCVCGSLGRPCSAGQNCEGGRCVCKPSSEGGRCSGCCDGDSCVVFSSQSVSTCGTSGASCRSCTDGNSCTDDACSSSGNCVNDRRPLRADCESSSGKCSSDDPPQCCKGCLDNSGRCQSGQTPDECGTGGNDCGGCVAAECKVASCSTGSCNPTAANVANDTPCDKDSFGCTDEKCQGGDCQQTVTDGCLIDERCVPEGTPKSTSEPDACLGCVSGTDKRDWSPLPPGTGCPDDGLLCTTDKCQSGLCTHDHDGTDTCLIDPPASDPRACYDPSDPKADDGCQVCDPDLDKFAFSPRPCDDGDDCTVNACTSGACDFSEITSAFCQIPGVGCVPDETVKEGAECFECDASADGDQTDWTVMEGKPCTQGQPGACASDGACCTGCLADDGQGVLTCETGVDDGACGNSGVPCEDCTTNSQLCKNGSSGYLCQE